MVLTIDIGNTTVAVGGFVDGELVLLRHLSSREELSVDTCSAALGALLEGQGDVEGAVLSSVVPRLTGVVSGAVQALYGAPVWVVGPELDTGLTIREYDTSHLGNDRIVDAVAALAQWSPPLVIFDMGTATTMSVVDGEGAFLGGMILPGLRLSVDALSAQAAQLPPITFAPPGDLIGKDTVSCMVNGALFGTAAAIEGLTQRVEEETLNHPATLVLTGGLGRHILPCLRRQAQYDEHLLMKGLYALYLRNRSAAWEQGS